MPDRSPEQVREEMMLLFAERDRQYAQRFEAQERAVAAALNAAEKAVVKAEAAAEKRFDGVNEFRAQLSDQAATFVTRAEYAVTIKAADDKIDELKGRADLSGGRTLGLSAGWSLLLGAISLLGALVAIVMALRRV